MKKSKPIAKKWIWISIAISVVVYSLIGFLIYPVKAYLSSDAVYAETVIPSLIDYFSDILEVGVVSLFYAMMIAFLYRYNGGMLAVFVSFTAVTLYKCLVNTVMTWINIGEVSLTWYWDMADVVFFTLLELVQMLIVYWFAKRFIDEFALVRETKLKFARENVEAEINLQVPYPYKKLFSMKNCLLKSALVCAIITFVAKASGTIIEDVWDIIIGGLPQQPQTWLLMGINYVSMILWGVLVYFVTIGAIAIILNKKKQIEAITK